jgi:hypothetical protein
MRHAQAPPTHLPPSEQAVPHAPQWSASVAVSTHAPSQTVAPAGHDPQTSPAPQASPASHPPSQQGSASAPQETQLPTEQVRPEAAQAVPLVQQACPSPPQVGCSSPPPPLFEQAETARTIVASQATRVALRRASVIVFPPSGMSP